ncbi:MAG TPA: lipocalin family protein [Chitinophagaceae bacterium]|nr:lipocalin family protein [Chitinophagaceae bacterium]
MFWSTIPKGAKPVTNFNKTKYLGTWYEIARLDFRFEKNLSNVTATYSLNANGTIKVVNKGYAYKKGKWKQSVGKAKFAGNPSVAKLKVSFFGPFYAPYNVIAIDEDYKYALVAGKNLNYMWILSRYKTIPQAIKDAYLAIAEELGYNVSALTWTIQSPQQ